MSFAPVGCASPAMTGVGVAVGAAVGAPEGGAVGDADGIAPDEQAAAPRATRSAAAGIRVRFDMRQGTLAGPARFRAIR